MDSKSREIAEVILPRTADNHFSGHRAVVWVFLATTLLQISVTCIHVFFRDGGAVTFAGISISGTSGSDIVSLVALWGVSELIAEIVFTVILIRYRSLIPLGFLLMLIEYSGRIMIQFFKPLATPHIPPGTLENYFMFVISLAMTVVCLTGTRKNPE